MFKKIDQLKLTGQMCFMMHKKHVASQQLSHFPMHSWPHGIEVLTYCTSCGMASNEVSPYQGATGPEKWVTPPCCVWVIAASSGLYFFCLSFLSSITACSQLSRSLQQLPDEQWLNLPAFPNRKPCAWWTAYVDLLFAVFLCWRSVLTEGNRFFLQYIYFCGSWFWGTVPEWCNAPGS